MKSFGRTRGQRVLLRIALYGGTVFIGVPLAFSYVMTKTYRSSSPARAPREYQELWLKSEGLRLRAWLAATNGERPAVVVVHGLGDSLESYLEHARPFRERGHSVLLDARHADPAWSCRSFGEPPGLTHDGPALGEQPAPPLQGSQGYWK